jgi:parallel beta-helix repeat protein
LKKTPSWGLALGTLLATAAVALVPGSLSAATGPLLYVDQANSACSDTGSGTVDQPFCTISAAATRVAAGQTVQVASGTYSEQVTIPVSGTSTAPITFTAAPGATVTVTGKVNGFLVSSKSWITISGFTVTNTSGNGIYISGSSYIAVTGNHVTYSGQPLSGYSKTGIALSNSSDSLVSNNTADHNTYAGIELKNGSTRDEVRDNVTFSNARQYERAAPGIRLYGSPGNVVDGNISHNNEDSGIEAYSGSNDTLIYNNVTYNNGDHGIDDYVTTGQRIFANTVYKNVTAGINVEGGSTGATLANNISVDNGIKSPRTHSDIRIESGSTSGTTLDYDVVYLSTPDTILIWSSVSYSSLAAFQAASGQEAHAVQASPLWTNPTGGDFHLTAGSPAIDSANSGANGQPSLDVEGNPRVDDPATPNTGIGPRPYDDRGAYEFSSSGSPPPPDSAPAAALTVTPSSGSAPLAVTADASASSDGDATPIASYSFDFGDGSAPVGPQAAPTAPHTYAAAGTYTVKVTVTDTGGLTATATAAVQAVASGQDAAPTAALALTPTAGTVNLTVTADASASSDTDATPIAGYSFDFGDGTPVVGPQSAATSAHTYTAPGTYTVTMTVQDTAGLSSAATAQVTVTDNPPAARLSAQVSGLAVTADASASTDGDATGIASYTFDFGDGSAPVGPQGSPTATHTYASAGSYVVKVTVTDMGGRSSTATSAVVAAIVQDAAPAAALTVTPTSGVINLLVNANASASTDADSTPISTYSFDFGDGTVASGPQSSATAAHTYTAPGTYTVKVTVQDTAGLSSTATSEVTVTDNPPAARLSVQASLSSVSADGSASTDGDATPIASYTFDFGDGSPPVGPQPSPTASHTYVAASNYTVTVTVKDTAGLASTAKRRIKLH